MSEASPEPRPPGVELQHIEPAREVEMAPLEEDAVSVPIQPAHLATPQEAATSAALSRDEEDQLARLQAYDDMGDVVNLFQKSKDVLIPDAVQKGVGTVFHVVDRVVDNIPRPVTDLANFAGDNVKLLASTTGKILESAPEMIVNVIPEMLMSKDTKKLLFVDFNNTLRSFFHTNILAMPFVFNETGIVMGMILITFIASMSLYATEVFMRAKNTLADPKKVMVYGDVPRMSFGDWYPTLNIFYGVIHLISFQAFAAHNMQVMLAAMGIQNNTYFLGLLLPALAAGPLVLMKNAKHQRPLSIVSNTMVFTCVCVLVFYFPFSKTQQLKYQVPSWNNLIIAVGIITYAFTGIGSAIPVERTMEPAKYIKLLRIAVCMSFVMLVAFGLAGYASYGSDTCAVITLSLQPGRTKTAISVMLFIASVAIIPQQVFPFAEVMDRRLLGLRTVPKYWDREPNLARIGAVAGCMLVAYLIPFYGLILSVGGSVGCGLLGLIIPSGLDYALRRREAIKKRRGLKFFEYLAVVVMGGFGIISLIVGVLFSLYDMWFKLQQGAAANAGGHSSKCG